MYADPTHIRKNRVNLALNDTEARLAEAMAEFNGMQTSVFLRELVLESLARMHGSDCAQAATEASYEPVTQACRLSNLCVTRK